MRTWLEDVSMGVLGGGREASCLGALIREVWDGLADIGNATVRNTSLWRGCIGQIHRAFHSQVQAKLSS
eukprot:354625-Chlamydomonas_euryale.AAC.5